MIKLLDRARARLARWNLARHPGVTIADDARIDARRVTLTEGCRLSVGRGSIVEATIDFEREGAELIVGENTFVGASMFKCAARIEIGRDVELAWSCTIVDHDWESLACEHRRMDVRQWYTAKKDWTHVPIGAVRVGDGALVGFNVVILKGVHIGEGAVIGVNSVVTRDVPPYVVAAGSPARVVRRLEGGARGAGADGGAAVTGGAGLRSA